VPLWLTDGVEMSNGHRHEQRSSLRVLCLRGGAWC